MERTRESKRSSMASSTAAGNGFHRRSRHRTIALRDSSEEGVSKRGRSKRRRSCHSRRDEGDGHSTEESVGNEQDDDGVLQDAGASATRSAANITSSFAASDQILRRSFEAPPLKVADEMIGVAVPRKARSASVKRSHENCFTASGGGGGGGGSERNFRQRSNSPVEPASPSSSSVSVKKKLKAIEDASETLKSSSSEIEIEIAELLYGLMTSKNSSSKDAEKKKVEECNSSCALVPCNSTTAELGRIQSKRPASVDCHDGNTVVRENGSSEAPKDDIEGDKKNSGDGCGTAADGRSVYPARELLSRSELDVDKRDSASTIVTSAISGGNGQRVGKFEIDLMAPPPMMLSPEGDDLSKGDLTSETKAWVLDLEMKREDSSTKVEDKEERPVKKEKAADEIEEAKMFTYKERCKVLKHDLEKPNNDNDTRTNNRLEEQDRNKEQRTKLSNPKVEKTAQSSPMPLSTAVSGRPNSLSPIGCTTPSQTVVKMDKTTGPWTTSKHLKRCATHHYIARNIFLHQQFTKMNTLLPPAVASGSLCGTKSNNVNYVPPAGNMAVGKQPQKHLPGVNQTAAQEKGLAATSDPSLTAIKSSNNANPMDSTQRMQLVLQQGPHPGSTGNLVHGSTFLFPLGQHQTSVGTSQAGGVNSTTSASSYNKCHTSAARSLATSSTLPAVGASMSFSYPSFSTSDSPYVTIVQNNGYSFPFSASVGANAAIRGASPAQATQILNGPFYSSQTIHPLQHPQEHPHSQVLVQPSYLSASTSGSSSSHKQSQGRQVNGNSILTSPTLQSQQSQKQQTLLSRPLKHETDMSGDNASSVTNRKSYPQKNVHGQHFTIPVQPVNLSFRSPAISDNVGGNSGNFGDKQQQRQALKGGVETIPSQAFAISFAGYNGTNIPSNLNFSSMAQNPVIFQSLPDMAWQGYQAAGVPHTTQQRTYSITEGNSIGNSSHQGDEKKTTHGKSSTNNGPTTLVFDNSSKNLNFVLSPSNGNWPSCSIASTAVTSVASTAVTSLPLSGNASSSQEPSQLLHLQKQYIMQQQQPAVATRYKASSTNITSATNFANSTPVFSQTQCKSSNQASNSRSSGRTMDSHVHHSSIITSKTPSLKSFSQEQGRVSQGRMQISFGGDYTTPLPSQGQQLLTNNRPLCTTVAGTPLNGGNLKPNPEGRKASSSANTSQSQQTENSSAGSGQKSSPVCGRNVPSILSSCPSQLSELKY